MQRAHPTQLRDAPGRVKPGRGERRFQKVFGAARQQLSEGGDAAQRMESLEHILAAIRRTEVVKRLSSARFVSTAAASKEIEASRGADAEADGAETGRSIESRPMPEALMNELDRLTAALLKDAEALDSAASAAQPNALAGVDLGEWREFDALVSVAEQTLRSLHAAPADQSTPARSNANAFLRRRPNRLARRAAAARRPATAAEAAAGPPSAPKRVIKSDGAHRRAESAGKRPSHGAGGANAPVEGIRDEPAPTERVSGDRVPVDRAAGAAQTRPAGERGPRRRPSWSSIRGHAAGEAFDKAEATERFARSAARRRKIRHEAQTDTFTDVLALLVAMKDDRRRVGPPPAASAAAKLDANRRASRIRAGQAPLERSDAAETIAEAMRRRRADEAAEREAAARETAERETAEREAAEQAAAERRAAEQAAADRAAAEQAAAEQAAADQRAAAERRAAEQQAQEAAARAAETPVAPPPAAIDADMASLLAATGTPPSPPAPSAPPNPSPSGGSPSVSHSAFPAPETAPSPLQDAVEKAISKELDAVAKSTPVLEKIGAAVRAQAMLRLEIGDGLTGREPDPQVKRMMGVDENERMAPQPRRPGPGMIDDPEGDDTLDDDAVSDAGAGGDLLSRTSKDATAMMFAALADPNGEAAKAILQRMQGAVTPSQEAIDRATQETLKPMLATWLEDNLPKLVERLVISEIEKARRGG